MRKAHTQEIEHEEWFCDECGEKIEHWPHRIKLAYMVIDPREDYPQYSDFCSGDCLKKYIKRVKIETMDEVNKKFREEKAKKK